MRRCKIGRSNLSRGFVGLQGLIGGVLALIASGELSQVAVIVAFPVNMVRTTNATGTSGGLHLMIEDFGLPSLGRLDQMLVEDLQDIFTDLGKLGLDLLAVLFNQLDLRPIAFGFFLLFDGSDNPPRRTARTDDILVCDGQQIALFDRKFLVGRRDVFHVFDHFCAKGSDILRAVADAEPVRTFIALGLLGELGQVNMIFVPHRDFFVAVYCYLVSESSLCLSAP